MSVYGEHEGRVDRGADLSEDGQYRYKLWRIWDAATLPLVVIGLNPSTADATKDDPTIRRCVSFARTWDCGGLVMLNLFAYRATHPDLMRRRYERAIGNPRNDMTLLAETGRGAGSVYPIVLCAWGAHGSFLDRSREVVRMLREVDRHLVHLGLTQAGEPKHPLYIPSTRAFVPFL